MMISYVQKGFKMKAKIRAVIAVSVFGFIVAMWDNVFVALFAASGCVGFLFWIESLVEKK